jgi:hypothetical protein
MWSTPSILWIITGREPLDWADAPRGTLPHRGAHTWPGLAGARGASAIHRVPPLADAEVDAALDAAEVRVGQRLVVRRLRPCGSLRATRRQ